MRKKQSQSEKDFSSQMKIRKTDNLVSKKGYNTEDEKAELKSNFIWTNLFNKLHDHLYPDS